MVQILLVEKDQSVSRLYKEEMEEAGFQVMVLRGLSEAVVFLKEQSVDMLVTDESTCAYSSPSWLPMVRRVYSGPVVTLAARQGRHKDGGGFFSLPKSSDLEPLIKSLKSNTISDRWGCWPSGLA